MATIEQNLAVDSFHAFLTGAVLGFSEGGVNPVVDH